MKDGEVIELVMSDLTVCESRNRDRKMEEVGNEKIIEVLNEKLVSNDVLKFFARKNEPGVTLSFELSETLNDKISDPLIGVRPIDKIEQLYGQLDDRII